MLKELKKFCCTRDAIASMREPNTKESLVNETRKCFDKINITSQEQLDFIIYHFLNESAPFEENDCTKLEDGCEIEMSTANTIYLLFWVVLLLFIVFSNLMVVVIMLKHVTRNNTTMFLSSLAISDMLVGLFLIPIKMGFTKHNQRFCLDKIYCRAYLASDNFLFAVSNTNLFIICIDTYIILTYPYKYTRLMSPKRCKLLLIFIWCYGLFWGILVNIKLDEITEPAIHIDNFQCSNNRNYIFVLLVAVVVFFIPAIVMAFLYFRIFSVSRYHAREISESVYFKNVVFNKRDSEVSVSSNDNGNKVSENHQRNSASSDDADRRSSKTIRFVYYRKLILKASKTVAIVYGTFVICWSPVICFSLVLVFSPQWIDSQKIKWFYIFFVEIIPIFKSTLNPFIYVLTNKQYRFAFKNVLLWFWSLTKILKKSKSVSVKSK